MNNRIGNLFKGDKVIWMVFFFLCMISVVEVFSASSGLTYKSQNYVGPIAYHAFTIMAGVVVAILTLNIPCRYFKLMTPFLMLISVITWQERRSVMPDVGLTCLVSRSSLQRLPKERLYWL